MGMSGSSQLLIIPAHQCIHIHRHTNIYLLKIKINLQNPQRIFSVKVLEDRGVAATSLETLYPGEK